MNIIKVSKLSAFIGTLGVIGLLAACGGGVSGKYVSSDGSSYTFQSGNKVLYENARNGVSEHGTYKVFSASAGGHKVTEIRLHANDEDQGVLILRPDGCLSDMLGDTYCRH